MARTMEDLTMLVLQVDARCQALEDENAKLRKEAQEKQVKQEKLEQQVKVHSAKLEEVEDCVRRNALSIAQLAKQVKQIQPLFDNIMENGKKMTEHINKNSGAIRGLLTDMKDCGYNFAVCRHTQTELAKIREAMYKFNGTLVELAELKAFMEAGFTAAKSCNLKRKDDIDNIRRRVTYLEGGKPAKRARAAGPAASTSTPEAAPAAAPAPVEAQVHTLYDTNGTAALQVAQLPTEPGVAVKIPLIPFF